MKGMIKQVVEAQKESDKKFAELEEKRMKMEDVQQEREAQMCCKRSRISNACVSNDADRILFPVFFSTIRISTTFQ